MIGILLITHGTFGESLIQNACHVLRQRPLRLDQIGVTAEDDQQSVLALARPRLAQVDGGAGALLLTDMLGATPSNAAQQLLLPGRFEGVAGVSLPMLLRALTYRSGGMDELLRKVIDGGRDGIVQMPQEQ